MNFLAHLHLAMLADSSLLGNLLADFVRGNPAADYQPDVVAGIMMHRRVDVLTDSLPQVKASRDYFSAPYRRVAPITLDVVWTIFWRATGSSWSLHATCTSLPRKPAARSNLFCRSRRRAFRT